MRHLHHTFMALTFVLAANASAADLSAPLPPVRPWHGASERLIVPPSDPWATPAEAREILGLKGGDKVSF